MMKLLKKLSLLTVVVMLIAMLPACGSKTNSNSSSGSSGGMLTVALSAIPKSIDPVKYTGTYEGDIIMNVADTLVAYKQDLSSIIPDLATSWTVSSDGKVYDFKLRNDAYFQKGKYQNGRQMKAEDVKYSLERSAKLSAMQRLSMLDHVDVINDFEVKCYLKKTTSTFLTALTDAGNAIVPKEEVEGWGDAFGTHLVGTGPFSVVSWKNGDNVVLKKNDKYWGQKSHLSGLTFKFITDPNTMVNSLRTGEIDVATDLTGETIKLVKDDSNLVLDEKPGMGVSYFYLNLMTGPTKDIRVREAMIQAVDFDQMVKGIYQYGDAQRAYLMLPPGSWGYDKSLESMFPAYNPQKAKQLLAEAGYPNGFKTQIYIADKPARVKMATILQQYLKKNLNIDLEIKTADWGTFSDIASKGKAPIYGMSWSWYPDPYFFLNQIFYSPQIGSLGNGQGFKIPAVDKLLNEAEAAKEQSQRADYYKQALKIITEQYACIPYSNEKVITGLSKHVQGYQSREDEQIVICSQEVNVSKN